MDFNLDELLKQQKENEDAKAMLDVAGSIGQSLSNVPSAADLMIGKKTYDPNVKSVTDSLKGMYKDPLADKMKEIQAKGAFNQLSQNEQMNDPNSEASTRYGQMLGGFMPQLQPYLKGRSQKEIETLLPMMTEKLKADRDWQNQLELKKMDQSFRDKESRQNFQNELSRDQFKSLLEQNKHASPDQKLKALSGTDKARFDNAMMTLKALDDMGAALDKGDNTFSLVGDNDYTAASRRATEAYGRMQSGGAINKDEEARFEKTLPRSTDDKEMQRKKILTQRDEMISRLKTLGFTPNDVGYTLRDFEYGKNKTEPISQPTGAENSKAMKWAMENPKDPRAIEILKRLGIKVGGK